MEIFCEGDGIDGAVYGVQVNFKTPTGATTPLVNHLKVLPALLKEYRGIAAGVPGKDQPTLTDFVRRMEPLPEKRVRALNNKVAAMVALDLQVRQRPLSTISKYFLHCRKSIMRLPLVCQEKINRR